MKVFIGIDPSLSSTGLCVLDQGGGQAILKTMPCSPNKGAQRLYDMEGMMVSELQRFSHLPALVAIEGYAFGSFSQRERLGEWGGVLRLCLYKLHLPYVEVPPSTLKKYVTGKGNSKKNQILLAVYKKWGVSCKDDNQADAYSLAQFIRTGQIIKPVKGENT